MVAGLTCPAFQTLSSRGLWPVSTIFLRPHHAPQVFMDFPQAQELRTSACEGQRVCSRTHFYNRLLRNWTDFIQFC